MTRPRRRVIRIRIWPIVISLMVTMVVSIGLAVYFTPDAVRYINLRRLSSADAQERARGMSYLVHHADEPKVRRACRRLFARDDPQLTKTLIACLRYAGVWGVRFGRPWLDDMARRVEAQAENAAGRAWLAVELGQAGWTGEPVTRQPAYGKLVGRLLGDDEPAVRYAALRAAATLAGALGDSLVMRAVADAEPTIARHAWILCGLRGLKPAVDRNHLKQIHPVVRQAVVFARPDLAVTLAGALASGRTEEVADWAGVLPYALRGTKTVDWSVWLGDWSKTLTGPAQMARWRAVLSAPDEALDGAALRRFVRRTEATGEAVDGVVAAVVSRLGGWPEDWPAWSGSAGRGLRELARLEAAPVASLDIEKIDAHWPYLPLIDAVRASKNATPDDLMPAFNAELAGMRHLAVRVALRRFDESQINTLIETLLNSYWDHHRTSGALMAALHGSHGDLLGRRAAQERQWNVLQCLKVAMRMLGKKDGYAGDVVNLFIRKDIAETFIDIAMLRTGDRRVLDELFVPFGGDGGRLCRLLDDERFEPFLRRHLPQMPPFGRWADKALQRFQTDVIRDWYLLNRPRLRFDAVKKQFLLAPVSSVH